MNKQKFQEHINSIEHKSKICKINISLDESSPSPSTSEIKTEKIESIDIKEENYDDTDTIIFENDEKSTIKNENDINNNEIEMRMDKPLSEEIRTYEEKLKNVRKISEEESFRISHTVNGLSMVQTVLEERGSFIETNIPYADPVFAGELLFIVIVVNFIDYENQFIWLSICP